MSELGSLIMPEFQARPDEVSGARRFRFSVTWARLYAKFPETSVAQTALQQTTNPYPWNRPPTQAEISWAMVVPKMQGARPKRRALELAPAKELKVPPHVAHAEKSTRYQRIGFLCGSAIAAGILLVLFLRTPPKPQPQPQIAARSLPPRVVAVPPVPFPDVEPDVKPAHKPKRKPEPVATKPEPIKTRKPPVPAPPVVDRTVVESSPPPPIDDPPDRVAVSARVHAPPVHGIDPAAGPIMLGGFESSRVLTKVKPVYPEAAAIAKVEGTVRVRATIGENGAVKGVELESGPAMLFPAASDAVRQWRFLPARLNGDPVEDVTHVNITFGLVK